MCFSAEPIVVPTEGYSWERYGNSGVIENANKRHEAS